MYTRVRRSFEIHFQTCRSWTQNKVEHRQWMYLVHSGSQCRALQITKCAMMCPTPTGLFELSIHPSKHIFWQIGIDLTRTLHIMKKGSWFTRMYTCKLHVLYMFSCAKYMLVFPGDVTVQPFVLKHSWYASSATTRSRIKRLSTCKRRPRPVTQSFYDEIYVSM